MEEGKKDIEFEKEDLDDSVVAEGQTENRVTKLREKLAIAEAKAKEYLDGWQRNQADFVNLRRRDEEAKSEFVKFAKWSIIEELVPVLDSFNLALAHGNKDVKPVYDLFLSVLRQNGLEELNPIGEAFDPSYHEAIGVVPTDKPTEDHKILEVVQKGYILIGKIIRPAKVKTGQYHG